MDAVERAKNIILTPKAEWPVIATEANSIEAIYRDYLVYIAAVPAIASFVGFALTGVTGFFSGLAWSVANYVLSLVVVYVVALIIDKLAPSFDGIANFLNAFKLAAYSTTAAWLAGVFSLAPPLAFLGLLGVLYTYYLLYLGLPVLMLSPDSKSLLYTCAVIVVSLVIQLLIAWILWHIFF